MQQTKKATKVLQVLPDFGYGGIESVILNYYKYINKEDVQFDFMCFGNPYPFHENIESMGSIIYYMPPLSKVGIIKYCYNIYKVIITGKYSAVHSNINYLNGVILMIARICKIKIRISHSHSTNFGDRKVEHFLPVLRKLIIINSTKLLACGEKSGIFLYKNTNFDILPNAIELKKFKKFGSENDLSKLSDCFNIPKNSLILGNVARFTFEKNHIFFISLIKQLILKNSNVVLILVGEGPLKSQIEKSFIEENLMDYVRFLGMRKDIPELMNLFDIFLLPSIFEGIPVTVVEAQASGTPCILSDVITNEVDMGLGLVKFSSINKIEEWINTINRTPKSLKGKDLLIENAFNNKGYNIENAVHMLEEIYNERKN